MNFYEILIETEVVENDRRREVPFATLKFPATCPYPTREEVECLLVEMGGIRNPIFMVDYDQIARDNGMTHCALVVSGDSEYMVPDEEYFNSYPTKEMLDKRLLGITPLCNRYYVESVREL